MLQKIVQNSARKLDFILCSFNLDSTSDICTKDSWGEYRLQMIKFCSSLLAWDRPTSTCKWNCEICTNFHKCSLCSVAYDKSRLWRMDLGHVFCAITQRSCQIDCFSKILGNSKYTFGHIWTFVFVATHFFLYLSSFYKNVSRVSLWNDWSISY